MLRFAVELPEMPRTKALAPVTLDIINVRMFCRVCGAEEPLKPCRNPEELAAFSAAYKKFRDAHLGCAGGGHA